ncbi:MAG: glutaredoxin 3 [Rickettsiales bacterium]|nr:glutaredoxin 3 [Rickettsiales bacterium]
MLQIIVYSKEVCPYCVSAKNLIKRKGAEFTEIKVTDDKIRDEMIKKSGGRMTVPQIFIGEKHIGGYDDLRALDLKGELDKLLK